MRKKNEVQQECDQIIDKMSDVGALSLGEIDKLLDHSIHKKTLQRRLRLLVESDLLGLEGKNRNQRYFVKGQHKGSEAVSVLYKDIKTKQVKTNSINEDKSHPIFSKQSLHLLQYLNTPSYGRIKTSYQASLIDSYIPNQTQYISDELRNKLFKSGKRFDKTIAAGTYAKHIGQRLLIDLAYHSSRLEGNTYSKLDTAKLIESGFTGEGKVHEETVMIMNHKEAILFLIENAQELTFTPFTIRNVHYLLSQDLLKNPNACGKVRQIEVNIGKSSYLPLNSPYQLEEHLALLLRKAAQIDDPFEQSFFLLMHISYLQAFEDVNKRTSRLTCNIPFIKGNLCPLSFIDVPKEDYFAALLYFYETNNMQPALDLFEWAYLKSCQQYDVVKTSLGEIDTYRVQYRAARKEIMGHIIRDQIPTDNIDEVIVVYCEKNSIINPDKFITMVVHDLTHLHSGAIIGLGITEAVFDAWKADN